MKFEEILKAQGLTEEQIKAVTGAMKKEKIYTTNLENADERYNKLKGQKEDLEGQLKTSNDTIKDLKKNNADNETLQKTIKEHETTIATLKETSAKKEKEFTIKSKLKDLGCTDLDYMLYKLGDIDKLDLEKDWGNKAKELKENNSTFFPVEENKGDEPKNNLNVLENKLNEGATGSETETIASAFAGALSGNY